MAIGDRPDDYALHATTSPAKVSLPTNYMFGGFAVRNKLPHDLANTLFGAAGDWQAYTDTGSMRFDEIVTNDQTVQVSDEAFAYPVGDGLNALSPATESVYVHKGRRIALIGSGLLGRLGLNSVNFLPETTTWIYMSDAGIARLDVVGAGDPAVPDVSEFVLVGVTTDLTDVISLDHSQSPPAGVIVDRHPWRFWRLIAGSGMGADLALEVIGGGGGAASSFDGGVHKAARMFNNAAGQSTLDLTNDGGGNALSGLGHLAITGNGTITGDVSLAGGLGSKTVTIGSDGSDTVNCLAAANLSDNVNLCTGTGTKALVVGSNSTDTAIIHSSLTLNANTNFGSTTMTGSGGTVSCTNVSATNVTVEEMRFQNSVTTLPGVAGRLRWNNTLFSFMDATGQVRTLDEAVRGFDELFTTSDALASTTATATRRIKATEPVWIEMTCRYEINDTVDLNYRLNVSGPLGNADILLDDAGTPAANKGYFWRETFYWTPTDNWPAEVDEQNYTFTVGLGAAGGADTLTAKRVTIKVYTAVQV
jgi:hypothetical protein